MKKIISICLVCLSPLANADPAPFGLEIGKATISDVKKKYQTQATGKNKYTHGEMLNLNTDAINIEGLKSVTAIFDSKDKLVAVLTTFPKNKFNFLFDTMRNKKYKLVKKNIPFVGNTSAEFKSKGTSIFLNAPHLSFEMSLHYIDSNAYKAFQITDNKEKRAKKKAEQSKL